MTTFALLIVIALICAIGSLFRPQWMLLAVAVVFVCVALLIGKL